MKDNAKDGRWLSISGTPSTDPMARVRAMGWNDWRNGSGFRDAYDSWKRKEQWAYERGRFQAAAASRHAVRTFDGCPVAYWSDDMRCANVIARTCGRTLTEIEYQDSDINATLRRPRKRKGKGK